MGRKTEENRINNFIRGKIMIVGIVGAQFGDEGKGSVVDYYSKNTNVVVRFQGGGNAGHTVKFDNIKYVLHNLPCGVLRENVLSVIGAGCTLNPVEVQNEIDYLTRFGLEISPEKLIISPRATLLTEVHKEQDKLLETTTEGLGTTRKGIGPSYGDKILRRALTLGTGIELSFEELEAAISKQLTESKVSPEAISTKDITAELFAALKFLSPYVKDTGQVLTEKMINNNSIIFEGAQGTFLDINHGTYPFVTSSSTVAGGICTSTGIPPIYIETVIGVVKAYSTRVGRGPFPTEMDNKTQEIYRDLGQEYGATTGRPRRCGYLDLPAIQYAVRVNGLDGIILTKVDILDSFNEITICTSYDYDSDTFTEHGIPLDLDKVKPSYETIEGWGNEFKTAGMTEKANLPVNLKKFIKLIEDHIQVPVIALSTGPNREDIVELTNLFDYSLFSLKERKETEEMRF